MRAGSRPCYHSPRSHHSFHTTRGSPRLTRRLYYENAFLREFEATVMDVESREGAAYVALDETAFYPGGGGQPPDRGRLGDVLVSDTNEEEGRVWHRVERALTRGARVKGAIDWASARDNSGRSAWKSQGVAKRVRLATSAMIRLGCSYVSLS